MHSLRILGFFAFSLLFAILQVRSYPMQTADCRSSDDCGPSECCVLGMMRYSTPTCLPMSQLDDYCKEDNLPDNKTLYFPNGDQLEVFKIYIRLCPCDIDYMCVDSTCVRNESYDDNYLY